MIVWWLDDDPRLDRTARERIAGAPAAHISAASTWEVAIKQALGRLEVALPEGESFPSFCRAQGFSLVGVDHADAWAVADLPRSRTDPFDRLIAATARRRGWTVVTADPVFDDLDVPIIRP